MTNSAQQAREALGAQLRDLRRDARLTARALAAECGFHFTKVSKIEHGTQSPSETDLELWCRACGAADRLADLVAVNRATESMYVEWRRANKGGMRHNQRSRDALYERTKLFRIYEPGIIPGLLQTAAYAETVVRAAITFNGYPDDTEDAVAVRLERQRLLYARDRQLVVVLEEQALRTHVGDAEVMHGQLDRLLSIGSMQRVSIGVIPTRTSRPLWPSAGFWIFDDSTVHVEVPSAELTITQRSEIAVYEKRFQALQGLAAYGADMRCLVAANLPTD